METEYVNLIFYGLYKDRYQSCNKRLVPTLLKPLPSSSIFSDFSFGMKGQQGKHFLAGHKISGPDN